MDKCTNKSCITRKKSEIPKDFHCTAKVKILLKLLKSLQGVIICPIGSSGGKKMISFV